MSHDDQGPDHLGTAPAPHDPAARDRRRRIVTLAALGGAAVVVGGGALAATAFLSTGAQPSEALPADTLAYASIDLDPSGKQKIEAITTLRKFPGFTEEIDIRSEDDLVEKVFEEAVADGECEGLDYAADVAPWLGNRAALAAVDAGEGQPSPVGVVQVDDEEQARDGLAALLDSCGASSDTGVAVADGWAVIAETQQVADDVVSAAAEGDLASDEAFQRWTGEAGDDGFLSFYVAGSITEHLGSLYGVGTAGVPELGTEPGTAEEVPDEVEEALSEFEGAAATVRFDDGGMEIEVAGSLGSSISPVVGSDVGGDLVASLPADTVAALGFGLDEGWLEAVAEQVVKSSGGEMSVEELYDELGTQSGLEVPEDVETLFGEGLAIALGPGLDPDAVANGSMEDIPVGVKIKGDAAAIGDVLDRLAPQLGVDPEALAPEDAGDHAVISPHDDFRAALVDDGSLGDNAAFREVVEADGATGVLFMDFDADDDWLVRLAEDDADAVANLAPLSAFGVSTWTDGEVSHGLVRLTTD